ncbi:MAG: hypothetical protein COA38_03520 [Fluviicola sp.]|nr:MAG: hypothetical protein COA38_03520 [Fluviicola sp.]
MLLSKYTNILLLLAVMGFTTIAALLNSCQDSADRKGSELGEGFKEAIENAETFKNIQLDSARHYAYEAHSLACEIQGELEKHTSVLLLSEIRFLQFGASDRLFKKVKSCESWFRERKFYKKAFRANLVRLEIISFLKGGDNASEDIEGLIETAVLSKSNSAKAQAYYFKMDKRDYTRKWEDDVHILDSARMFAAKANDSVLLAKIRIMSVLSVNGSAQSYDSTFLSLKQALEWNSPELKCMSYQSLGLEYMPNANLTDSAIHYLDKGIESARKWSSKPHELLLRAYKVFTYTYVSMMDSAIHIGKNVIGIAEQVKNRNVELKLHRSLAQAMFLKEELSKGIVHAQKTVSVAETMGDEMAMYSSKQVLSTYLIRTERYADAEVFADEMYEWAKKREETHVNDMLISNALFLKGKIKMLQLDLDQALYFYDKAEKKLASHTGNNKFYVQCTVFSLLLKKEAYNQALEYYNFMNSEYTNIYLQRSNFLYLKGKLMFHLNRSSEAVIALNEFLSADKSEGEKVHYDIRTMLTTLYEKQGRYSLALENNKEALRLKHEMDNAEDALKLEKIQSKSEVSNKEIEIGQLKIDRLEQQNSLNAQESMLQTRRLFIIFLCILLVLLAVIVVSVSRRAKDTIVRKELQRSALEKEQQIERLKTEESERTIELKNQLFANISHEFRTPLTLIQAPVEELMERASLEDQYSLQVVKRNADHLLVMVDEILELTRLDSGNTEISKNTFDIHAFIRELQMNFEPVFRQNSIKFEMDLPKEEYLVLADEYRLKMVLNNLLKNAFHHTPKEGVIRIQVVVNRDEETLELALFNSGEWIDDEFLPTIFDRYARSKEKEYSGYGIGLSFCKQIISLHDGEISAENVEGGVLLSFSIPTKLDLVESSIGTIDEPNTYPIDESVENREKTILIVEDNPEVQNLLKDILSSQYDIVLAGNGEEGIEIAMEHQPNLIISDIMMPKVGGTELVATLKGNFSTSHIPIILLSAKSAGHDRITGLETGADDYLTKPFSPKELKVRVKNLIEQREKLQRRFSKNVFLMPDEISSNSLDQEFLIRATDIVEAKLLSSGFNVEKFCRELSLNRNSVHQKLKSLIGLSASQFIKSVKLKKATTFLADERISIVEVSELSGFNNRQAFNKAFKDQFEMTPSEYRKECLSKNN